MFEQLSNYSQELSFRLQQDITKYQEVNQIFRKLDYVGYVNQIYDLFHNIMNSEYLFTIQELKKLQDQETEKFDFVEKYQVNSLIFKSNFQVICNSINDYLWVIFFNKVQQEFQRDIHSSIQKDSQQNSDIKVNNDVQQKIEICQNITTQQFQANESTQSQNKQEVQQEVKSTQIEQNNQHLIIQQQQETNNARIIREELVKMAEQTQQINQASSLNESLSQKYKEDLIRESFIEDQQEKLNKYLNYDYNNTMNTIAQSNMSVNNLQKNLEWIVQNYPDLDKVIKNNAPIKKDSIGSVNFSKFGNDSNDFVQSSETELLHIKMMTDLLEGQKRINQALPIEEHYQTNKFQHFDRKFSTVKPQDFQDKLAQLQQQEKDKSVSSQLSSAQKLKSNRDIKPQSNSIHKEQNPMPSQSPQVQKLYTLRNSATQFYQNGSKKNYGDNIFYYEESEEINSKLKKSNPVSGSQSTRNFQTSYNASGKRSPSFAFSKTPKVSVFSQQVKMTENFFQKNNKFY